MSSLRSSLSSKPITPGEIYVIIGLMFAGKQLLCSVGSRPGAATEVRIRGLDWTQLIVTHDGAKFPCWALDNLMLFEENFGVDAYDKLDVIGIDETQFFEDLCDFCCKAADRDGKTLILAGLDGDYLKVVLEPTLRWKRFESVLDVVPLADSVTKLTARCELCGKRAFFSLRKILGEN
ncbi:Thymidine kinase [Dillenia turbinata]|uniref:Thymidine kinase n=1 Tax=Dillenia turbinata TaxID=194707 RepID=A0AAN8YXY1_9MAGN